MCGLFANKGAAVEAAGVGGRGSPPGGAGPGARRGARRYAASRSPVRVTAGVCDQAALAPGALTQLRLLAAIRTLLQPLLDSCFFPSALLLGHQLK